MNGLNPLALVPASGAPRHRRRGIVRGLAALAAGLLAVVAVGCGGGGLGSGGTGAPLAGGSGTITGFGSVVVDGVTLDDRGAAVLTEDGNGRLVPGASELGQRVEFDLDATGVPTTLRIDPQLVGPITEVQPLLRRLVVLGHTVQLNPNAQEGPSTVLAGVADLAGLVPGRWVEVHGVEGVAPLTGAPLLQATRIRALASPAPALRVSGRVESVDVGTGGLRLGGLSADLRGAVRLPAGAAPGVDDRVTLLARPGDLGGTAAAPVLTTRVVILRTPVPAGQRVLLAGKVRSLEPGRSLLVEGVQVLLGSAAISEGSLGVGRYVRVEGQAIGPRQVQATAIAVRAGSPEGDVELKGTVLGLAVDGRSFQVRGTRVTLPASGLALECEAGLANGRYVELRGAVEQGTLVATRVRCVRDEPGGAVVEREGVAVDLVPATRSFALRRSGQPTQPVQWSDVTVFRDGLAPTDLAGRALEVEGVLRADGVLAARRIRAAD